MRDEQQENQDALNRDAAIVRSADQKDQLRHLERLEREAQDRNLRTTKENAELVIRNQKEQQWAAERLETENQNREKQEQSPSD